MLSQTFVVGGSVRLVSFAAGLLLEESFFTPERHCHQTRHVEGRTSRGDGTNQPNNPAVGNVSGRCCFPENFILRPESAKGNNAADSKPAREEGPVGVGHVFLQTTHTAHVLFVMHSMDYAAGTKKHQCLEKCVSHHVEDADRKRADPASHKHEAELRHS